VTASVLVHIDVRVTLDLIGAVKCLFYGSGMVLYGGVVLTAAVATTILYHPYIATVTAFAVALGAVCSIDVRQEPADDMGVLVASAY
jgi:hypothetical protein